MDLPFEPSAVVAAARPLVAIDTSAQGPVGARAAAVIAAPSSRVWAIVSDPERFAAHVPMIDRVRASGDRVRMELRFRVALLSVAFRFETRRQVDEGKSIVLSYVEGEPRDTTIRFDLAPVDEGKTVLYTTIGFDILSLGWLVKTFLKHHPEIRFGVFPGSALSLLDAVRRAVEAS